jgi:hypothetical protein
MPPMMPGPLLSGKPSRRPARSSGSDSVQRRPPSQELSWWAMSVPPGGAPADQRWRRRGHHRAGVPFRGCRNPVTGAVGDVDRRHRSWTRLGPIAKSPRRLSPETSAAQRTRERERSVEADRGRQETPHRSLEGAGAGELVSPTRRRRAVEHLQRVFGVSQRWASQLVGQPRSTQRHQPVEPDWDRALRAELRQLSWGYRQPGGGHRAARQPLLIVDDRSELLWARRDTASKDERGLHTLEACGLVP